MFLQQALMALVGILVLGQMLVFRVLEASVLCFGCLQLLQLMLLNLPVRTHQSRRENQATSFPISIPGFVRPNIDHLHMPARCKLMSPGKAVS